MHRGGWILCVFTLLSVSRGAWAGSMLDGWSPKASLQKAGVRPSLRLLLSVSGVAQGGLRQQTQPLGVADGFIDFDLEPLLQWEGGQFRARVVGIVGDGPTQAVGDDQGADYLDAETAAYPYELWLQQTLGPGSLRLGLLGLDQEFAVLPATQVFTHSSFGTPAAWGASGLNGPGIYPVSALGGRFSVELGELLALKIAVVDGVPGDPNQQGRFDPSLRVADGVVGVGELTLSLEQSMGFRAVAGGYIYSEPRQDLVPDADDPPFGGYLLFQKRLLSQGRRALTAFGQLDGADGRFNRFELYIGGGLSMTGIWLDLPSDALGLAVGSASYGSTAAREGLGEGWEHAFELTYRAEVFSGIFFQPVLQYIVNPGGAAVDDAVVWFGRMMLAL